MSPLFYSSLNVSMSYVPRYRFSFFICQAFFCLIKRDIFLKLKFQDVEQRGRDNRCVDAGDERQPREPQDSL